MNIIIEKSVLSSNEIRKVEQIYNARFVCESSIKTKTGDWTNFPVAIFYTDSAHPEGSNWFGIYIDRLSGSVKITNGISACEPFNGLQVGNTVIYSRYRHDFQSHENDAFIDGGREYTRYGLIDDAKLVQLQIDKDKLEIVNGNDEA